MFIQKNVLILFVFLLAVLVSFAQNQALSKIDIGDMKRHLSYIASDELQGRRLGTEVKGLEITANYLAEQAQKVGVRPASGTYFQRIELVSSKPINDGLVRVNDEKKMVYESKGLITIAGNRGITEFKSEDFVFIGFGDDELEEVELEGKIAVCSQGNSKLFQDGEWENAGWSNYAERMKYSEITKKNPKALIVVLLPNEKAKDTYKRINRWMNRERFSLASDRNETEVPVLLAPADFGDVLVGKRDSYKKLLVNYANKPDIAIFKTKGKSIDLKFGSSVEPVDAKNVIGIVEGSDPELKKEYIVFLAHYDHLGISDDEDVYNGADDNGSGTVAILEVAEAFASLKEKPKRSIVFLWVSCEEVGHLGSSYYAENPVFPLEKTVAAINLDMVGRVYEGPRDDVWKNSPKKVKDFDGLYTLSNDVWPQLAEINAKKCEELGLVPDTSLPKERFLRSSDHYQFHKKGVPILNYATGYHADYHKEGDEVEKINFKKMKRVADLCFLIGYEVANMDSIKF